MAADFPPAGLEIGGSGPAVLRQAGQGGHCQGGMFLAYVSPLGRALVDKRLYLPKSWTSDQATGVLQRVCRRTRGTTGQITELALEMLVAGVGVGLPGTRAELGCRR